MADSVVVAKQTAHLNDGHGLIQIHEGSLWAADHPLVLARPELFESNLMEYAVLTPGYAHPPTIDTQLTYAVGGTVTGLVAGSTVVLVNNGIDDLAVTANGPFVFAQKMSAGARYVVTVKTPAPGQACIAGHNAGTMATADVTDVTVLCKPPVTP